MWNNAPNLMRVARTKKGKNAKDGCFIFDTLTPPAALVRICQGIGRLLFLMRRSLFFGRNIRHCFLAVSSHKQQTLDFSRKMRNNARNTATY